MPTQDMESLVNDSLATNLLNECTKKEILALINYSKFKRDMKKKIINSKDGHFEEMNIYLVNENWINKTLVGNSRMRNADFKVKIGNTVIGRCEDALRRIREGIHIIETDETSFIAFCFMNRVIFLQNSIKNYAKKHGAGVECSFQDFINPKNAENNFGWRPFQIAFIPH